MPFWLNTKNHTTSARHAAERSLIRRRDECKVPVLLLLLLARLLNSNNPSTDLGQSVDLQYMCLKASDDGNENGNNPQVILLHGLLGQKRNLASLGSAFATQLELKRVIYAVDLRNLGDNTHDWRVEMSYSHMAHDVIAFIDKYDTKYTQSLTHWSFHRREISSIHGIISSR